MKQMSIVVYDGLCFVVLTSGPQISYLTLMFLPAGHLTVSRP